jgi:glycosyltransferase involved in cell wall biosynthesis
VKLSIVSTVTGGYTWAGSEEMWRLIAETALVKGYSVKINLATSMAGAAQLGKVKSLGGVITPRQDLSFVTRQMAQRGAFSRFRDLVNLKDEVIVLSMGALADCLWIPDLLRTYERSQAAWMVIVQCNGEHLLQQPAHRAILRRFYEKAKTVVFVSHQNLELAKRQLAWRFTNAVVIPNPIRERLTKPLPWPPVIDDIWRLAEVARFEVFQKRQDQLLEALATPDWKARSWKLTFYGSGPDEPYIRSLVGYYGLESKVDFGGYVRDFREIWQNNHLHILPTAYEGLPLSLIESMFCGRPAVVTRAGGNAELVDDGQEGFVSPGMHPEIISETLNRAWLARELWQQMGEAAFARADRAVPKDLENQLLALVEAAANA